MHRRSFLAQGFSSIAFALSSSSQALADSFSNFPDSLNGHADDAAIARLRTGLRGEVYLPGSDLYEKRRKGFAAKVDLHPALIVHAISASDVQMAIAFAQAQHMPLAVRCGGHSYAGYSTCDDGIVIDLSGLKELTVSADKRSIRVGGGVLTGELDKAAAAVNCAVATGQCPSVGVGGYFLGGGVGPLMSSYGLGCDNVLSAEIVLADGKLLTISPRQHPDLFWAIRGGGGNFGVVTAFEIALHPVQDVLGGFLSYTSEKPLELLHILRDLAALPGDAFSLIATLTPAKSGKYQLEAEIGYAGDLQQGEERLAPLRRLPQMKADGVKRRSFLDLKSLVPADISPQYWESRGGFLPSLDDEVMTALVQAMQSWPATYNELSFLHLHGAVTRIPTAGTAFPLRTPGFACGIASAWSPAHGRDASVRWVDETTAKLASFGRGAYINVMDRQSSEAVRNAYGPNYDRLAALKARFDPSNVFSINQNIRPLHGERRSRPSK